MKGAKYPPFARPVPVERGTLRPEPDALPSIDDFLDELPSIDDFLAHDFLPKDYPAEEPVAFEPEEQQEIEPGWAAGSWQNYDWASLASLNRSESGDTAAEAWRDSEWPEPQPARESRAFPSSSPTADEVADALDGIARRIRSGELVIDNLHGTPPEAAMAAALAIVLRMRG